MPGTNTAGLAALEAHRHQTYFGRGRHKICESRSRRTGLPCRDIAMRDKNVCRKHGGHSNGRKKKPLGDRTEGQRRNFGIRRARALAAKDMETRRLHPETIRVYAAQYAGRVASSDLTLFLRSLDDYLQGNMDSRAWRDALEKLVDLLEISSRKAITN